MPAFSENTFEGGVSKLGKTNQVLDASTLAPISSATISLPQSNFMTKTDKYGHFDLGAQVSGDTILSVEKEGYKPFSLTVNDKIAAKPIIVGIEKSKPSDILITSSLIRLGDNNYSESSANASEFHSKASGPYYNQSFTLNDIDLSKTPYIVIGSIVGIDTLMAKKMRQNNVINAYSSPPEIYFNGNKIAEIQLNGDKQRIKIPKSLIHAGENEVTVKTGRNLMQNSYVDYDDIEFANISIEFK